MNKRKLVCIVIAFILIIIGLVIYNLVCDFSKFLEVNAINCLNSLIVVAVSFFIVQRQTDRRKQKDIFIKLLESLMSLVDDKKSYNLEGVEKEEMLMRTREISIKIDIIKKYSTRFNIKNDVDFLEEKFKEYQTVIDDHSTEMNLLSKLHKELKRPLNLISQRIFDIMLELYN